ncbi:hypothetical protein K438DRAFT_1776242 [Mycena galopus ATCC 62051]|nr:hypothetical protein K438DRAFT_1776242 [Mycena galopus ATCC 62051]
MLNQGKRCHHFEVHLNLAFTAFRGLIDTRVRIRADPVQTWVRTRIRPRNAVIVGEEREAARHQPVGHGAANCRQHTNQKWTLSHQHMSNFAVHNCRPIAAGGGSGGTWRQNLLAQPVWRGSRSYVRPFPASTIPRPLVR